MATTYVESSALVKRYVAEVGSAWVRRTVARPVHQVLYTAALTEVEVRSALQRLVREGRLDIAQAQRLPSVFAAKRRRGPGGGEPHCMQGQQQVLDRRAPRQRTVNPVYAGTVPRTYAASIRACTSSIRE